MAETRYVLVILSENGIRVIGPYKSKADADFDSMLLGKGQVVELESPI